MLSNARPRLLSGESLVFARLLSGALFGAAIAFSSRNADALEREHHLGLDPNLAMLKIDDKSSMSTGAGIGAHYTYGVNDQFDLLAEASYAIVALNQQQDNPDSPHTRPATVTTFSMGVGYVLDVLRFVPYFGLLGTGAVMSGGTLQSAQLLIGGTLALGLDYRITPHVVVGIGYRQHEFLTQASTYPSYSVFQLRAEYIF